MTAKRDRLGHALDRDPVGGLAQRAAVRARAVGRLAVGAGQPARQLGVDLVALPLHYSGAQRMNTDLYTISFLLFIGLLYFFPGILDV